MTIIACRLCGHRNTRPFVDLGVMPLSCGLVPASRFGAEEDQGYPLRVAVCETCLLVQQDDEGLPDLRCPPAATTAADEISYATSMIGRFGLGPESLVMAIGCAGGGCLAPFHAAGIPVVGIGSVTACAADGEPAPAAGGVVVLNAETAMDIAVCHGRADFVIARDVLAEARDLYGFAAGFAGILRPGGVVAFEFPHLPWLMEHGRIDTMRHGRRSYLSLLVVEQILRSVGLLVFDLERVPPSGRVLRVFAGHQRGPFARRPSVRTMRMREMAMGLARPAGYDGFAARTAAMITAFRDFTASRGQAGRRVAAFGATAEAATWLNCCGTTEAEVMCIGDVGAGTEPLFLPGCHLPVVSPETVVQARPDDVLVFPRGDTVRDAADLALILPRGTRFWVMSPGPRALVPHSVAA